MTLVEAARPVEVEAAARRILGRRPNQPLAMKALSFGLIGQEKFADALPILRFVTVRNPHDPELHNNLGIVLSELMRWDEAIACFDRARSLDPNDAEILRNFGYALFRLRRWNEAVPFFLEAIEKHPGDYVDAVHLLASALDNAARHDEAWACYSELYAADRNDLLALYKMVHIGMRRCDWQHLSERLEHLREVCRASCIPFASPFPALAFPGFSGEDCRRIAGSFADAMVPRNVWQGGESNAGTFSVFPLGQRRLRVGYLSGDFRDHPVGRILGDVIKYHDRATVEVFAYSTWVEEGSDVQPRLKATFEHFADVSALPVRSLADRIRADGIDVLVDLAGWTANGRPEAMALRCAPVQVNWLGYAGTMGRKGLADYILGDPVVTPLNHAGHFSEIIAQLPGCYLPADITTEPGPCPSRSAAGLPESGFVFCSFNNSYKFNPTVLDLWCRILVYVPDSVLWLSKPNETAQGNLQVEAAKRGIDPERIVFAPRVEERKEHLARLRCADLALDPFPYNSHSTGLDALWAGVPMIGLMGETFPSRVGASMLSVAGMTELIARTEDDYVNLAIALVQDRKRLEAIRETWWQKRLGSPLFDMPAFAAALEDRYFAMRRAYDSGHLEPISAS